MQFETETHEVVEWLPVPINLVGRPTNGPETEYTFSQLRDEVSRSDSVNQSKKGGWAIAGEHRPKNGAVPSTARPSHLAGGTDKERELSTRRRRWPRQKRKQRSSEKQSWIHELAWDGVDRAGGGHNEDEGASEWSRRRWQRRRGPG